ncbi:MAG: GerW family sporulation protein [Ruthenibacterium lactatiformans]
MSQHPIEGLMDVTLEKIKSMVDSNTIIGNPINMADGTVLPISSDVRVRFRRHSFPSKTTKDLFGGGGGAGVSISPWLSWW